MFGEEPALGADRDDNGILDLLRLDQSQHLGAEIVTTVGPAQAAPRDRAEAKMHTLDMRGPDEDLPERLRQGQIGQFARGDLDRDMGLGPSAGAGLVVVGAFDRLDEQDHPAQGPVVVEALHVLKLGVDRLDQPAHGGLAAGRIAPRCGIEFGREQGQQAPGHGRIVTQRLFLHRLAGVQPRLLAIAGEGPHQRRLAPVDAQLQHQTIESVAFRQTGPDRRKGRLERALHIRELKVAAAGILQQEFMHMDLGLSRRTQGVAPFLKRLQPHVGEDRQHVRKRHRSAAAIEFEAEIQ